MIEISTVGRIISGTHRVGWYVYVKPADLTGIEPDYFVYISNVNGFDGSWKTMPGAEQYDHWVSDHDDLIALFETFDWQIEWIEQN